MDQANENARLALNLAVGMREDGQSAAQITTVARRFYKFLASPEGAKDAGSEE